MEVLKISDSVSFDVIYGDGTKRHVSEGVCLEACDNEIIFHNGTCDPAVTVAAAEDLLRHLRAMGAGLALLVIKMNMSDESRQALHDLVWFGDDLLNNSSAEKEGIFRLGQMDMKENVLALLHRHMKGTRG